KQGVEPEPAPTPAPAPAPVPDPMARTTPATPAPGRRQSRPPVGGGLVRAPETRDGLIRHAIEHLHYRNTAAILAALNFKDIGEITDCPKAWEQLVKLAPAEPPE
ncbi:MAG: hypothetical protein MUO37_05200, partial [Methyloceanibacter sp.]|nr:hypothetical protein [Methyloceanibacter sp.]